MYVITVSLMGTPSHGGHSIHVEPHLILLSWCGHIWHMWSLTGSVVLHVHVIPANLSKCNTLDMCHNFKQFPLIIQWIGQTSNITLSLVHHISRAQYRSLPRCFTGLFHVNVCAVFWCVFFLHAQQIRIVCVHITHRGYMHVYSSQKPGIIIKVVRLPGEVSETQNDPGKTVMVGRYDMYESHT